MKNKKAFVLAIVISAAALTGAGILGWNAVSSSRFNINQTDSSANASDTGTDSDTGSTSGSASNTSDTSPNTDTGSTSDSADASYMHVTYDGVTYDYNTDLRNILFLGVDKTNPLTEQTPSHAGQADCLILLCMDTKTKTTKMLSISRDSMTEVKIYGTGGSLVGTQTMQVAAQYAYGDGKKKSCLLTKEAVSKLLYGIPIRSYMALDISGISPIVDALGGLPVTLSSDWTWIDPTFTAGKSLTLNGEMTTKLVRSRDTSLVDSNNDRMVRQNLFLHAFIKQVQTKAGGSSAIYDLMLNAGRSYLETDIQDDEIHSLSSYTFDEESENVPGTVTMGDKYAEYNVNRTELYKILIKLLYKPAAKG